MADIGSLCGRFHRIAQAFPEAQALEVKQRFTSIRESLEKLTNLADEASAAHDIELVEAIAARRSILGELGAELATSQRLAICAVIHGDFYCSHVVRQANRPVAVIDVVGDLLFCRLGTDARFLPLRAAARAIARR